MKMKREGEQSQEMPLEWRKRLATLVSNLFNPFLLSIVIIILISIEASTSTRAALLWSLLSLALTILPIFAILFYLVRSDRLDDFFIKVRQQRYKIYLLSAFCVAVGCAVLYWFQAPLTLVAAFIAGLTSVVLFMGINFIWKISVHTAFASAAITILCFLYGMAALFAVLLLPLVGWSRIELEHHSPTQVATGAVLAAVVVLAVFSLFGLT
jgi:membrane-associated phospholipid phosphatase